MKLRIKGNSIRLRMNRSEVNTLAVNGAVEEKTAFGTDQDQNFTYRIEKSEGDIVNAGFQNGTMLIRAPAGIVDEWAAADQLGFSGRQMLEDGSVLDILVEKDLTCLKPRDGEDESDNFPNPESKVSC